MATEGTWSVITDVSQSDDSTLVVDNKTFEANGDISSVTLGYEESWATQKGSQYLYILKEQLVSLGWTVVSSSRRTNYTDEATNPGSRDRVTSFTYDPTGGSNIEVSGTVGGITYKRNKSFFSVSNSDLWLPSNGIGTPTGETASFYDGGRTDGNPSWAVIYPGYVPDNTITTSSYLRNINSGYFNIGSSTRMNLGRSWCLLKAPTTFKESGAGSPGSGCYHILLDYISNTAGTFDIPFYNPGAPSSTFKNFDATTGYSATFGSTVSIYVFPDYGDSYTNLVDIENVGGDSYIPDQFKRPSHLYEVGTILNTTNGGPAGIANYAISNRTVQNQLYSNILYDSANGSVIFISSENGVINSFNILGTIADGINPTITQQNGGYNPGTKFFFFWSNLQRSKYPLGSIHTPNAIVGPTSYLNTMVDLSNTIFDFSENNSCMYYYKKYSPTNAGVKYEDARLVTCIPVFVTEGTKFKPGKKGTVSVQYPKSIRIWNKSDAMSKPTTDYTYVEWPLPLLAVVPGNSNYAYAGRMMDIKLGPLGAIDGIIAQDPTSLEFDRILLNGIWFPFGGTESLIY